MHDLRCSSGVACSDHMFIGALLLTEDFQMLVMMFRELAMGESRIARDPLLSAEIIVKHDRRINAHSVQVGLHINGRIVTQVDADCFSSNLGESLDIIGLPIFLHIDGS